MLTWKFMTFVASGISLFAGAVFYRAGLAKERCLVRKTPFALQIIDGNIFESRNLILIKIQKRLHKFVVFIPGGVVNTAYPAIQAAGSQ
jgi:hypothetical protein